jgi:hypothetical protein
MENNIYNSDDSRFVNKKLSNVKSDLIEITEDKLENILLKHLKKIGIKTSWLAPLGLFISVTLAFNTSIFTDKFGMSSNTWEAIFFLTIIGSGLWLIISLFLLVKN